MLFYVYLGYPILVFLFSMVRDKRVKKGNCEPRVTILIAAYNEEDSIEGTLKNKLDLNYPKKKLEIIVISDASTDRTDEIVQHYENKGVKLLRQEPRAGKTSALNMAVPETESDILVFSDANSLYAPDTLTKLVQNFSDPNVGYVTGKMIYTNPDGTTIGDGCTAYMKYENYLRRFETKICSIVGVDGGVDAVRKSLYQTMNPDQLPDFVLPLKVVAQGYRVVYEPEAILKETSLKSPKDEYRMRVRVSLRALWALSDMRKLFNLKKFKLFTWQLCSHKVSRYLCFVFLIAVYFTNLALCSFYKFLLILQNVCYLGAIVSLVLEKCGYRLRPLYPLHYFVLLNLAAAHALLKFLLGQKQVIWTPRKG